MDFPAEPDTRVAMPDVIVQALGTVPTYCGKNRLDYLVEISSEDDVRNLRPDLRLLETLDCRGIIVTARAKPGGVDFVSRFFAPAAGVPEDPVTGSAHCCLGPYWQRRLRKSKLTGYQASPRGGTVGVEVIGDRVKLAGQAVTVMEARLLADV
jgi:PhzF family phenazine biosynthesis protein